MSRDDCQRQMAKLIIESEARFHPDGARRFLAQNRNGRFLRLEPEGLWVVPGYRFQMFYQIALREVYGSVGVQQRIRQDPEFSAWILDALYWPQSLWRRGEPMKLSSQSFRGYLCEQIQHVDSSNRHSRLPRPDENIHFLEQTVLDLIEYLRFPRKLFHTLLESLGQALRHVHADSEFQLAADEVADRSSGEKGTLYRGGNAARASIGNEGRSLSEAQAAAAWITKLYCSGLSRPLLPQSPEPLEFRDKSPQGLEWEFSFFGKLEGGRSAVHKEYLSAIAENDFDGTLAARFSQLHNFFTVACPKVDLTQLAQAVLLSETGKLTNLSEFHKKASERIAILLRVGSSAWSEALMGKDSENVMEVGTKKLLHFQMLQQGMLETTRPEILLILISIVLGKPDAAGFEMEMLSRVKSSGENLLRDWRLLMSRGGAPDFYQLAHLTKKVLDQLSGVVS